MNGRLDHPFTDPYVDENREIFKNRSRSQQQVFQRDMLSEALFFIVLGASSTAASALVGRPTDACSLRPLESGSSPARPNRCHKEP